MQETETINPTQLEETPVTPKDQTESSPVKAKGGRPPKFPKVGPDETPLTPPKDWIIWLKERAAAGEKAEITSRVELDSRNGTEKTVYDWEGDTSWPVWLGYPHVRTHAENVGRRGGDGEKPKAAPMQVNTSPVPQGMNPQVLTSFPWPLRLIASDFGESHCYVYVRADVWEAE